MSESQIFVACNHNNVAEPLNHEIIILPTDEEIKAHYMAYSEKALDVINWYKQRLGL